MIGILRRDRAPFVFTPGKLTSHHITAHHMTSSHGTTSHHSSSRHTQPNPDDAAEFAYVMGGTEGEVFKKFIGLCCTAYNLLRSNVKIILTLFTMVCDHHQ